MYIVSNYKNRKIDFNRASLRVSRTDPAAIFSSREEGVWFDPSDLSTMFQDAAGTTPVTAPGQSVGLVLDKSKGLGRGPELVTNGTFDTNVTGWSGQANATLASVGGELQVTLASTSSTYVFQDIPTTAGRSYRLTLQIRATSGALNVGVWSGPFTGVIFETSNIIENGVMQTVSFVFTATTATTRLGFGQNGSSTTYFADNISVKELPGNHATQATAASRPTYGIVPRTGRRNLLTYSEQFDNAVWVKLGTTSVTANTAIAPDGATTVDRIVIATGNNQGVRQDVALAAGTYRFSVWARAVGSATTLRLASFGLDGPKISSMALPTGSFVRYEATLTYAVGGTAQLRIDTNDLGGTIEVWGAQLETGSTATNYQRVGSAFDVTEAGVPSLSYLSFDGVDDFLVTPTITPEIDKAQVFAGVRQVGNNGMIAEHSVSADANNGAFYVYTGEVGSGDLSFGLRGSQLTKLIGSAVTPPVTRVVSGSFDIAGASRATEIFPRINGAAASLSGFGAADAGTGNFLAYPLYIGRRGGTTLPFNGHIYGLITRFGSNLTSDQITKTETWMNSKTGAY